MNSRKIIHIDCDCYYAALEIRDFPELRGLPVAVGGSGPRGVLSTCNYEARAFGVRSAMPTARARQLCPDLIVQPSRFDVYRSVSREIRGILERYADKIEPLSLDEAFLDVSETTYGGGSATRLAQHIRAEVAREVGITVSAGIAPNKYLAKIASDWNKPNGQFVITPTDVADFVYRLPVERLFGVGRKTAERMHGMGYRTCGDLQRVSLAELIDRFGRFGSRLFQLARGIDDRPVKTERLRKSLSVETTFATDLAGIGPCHEQLPALYEELTRRLSKPSAQSCSVHRIFLKMRFRDFSQTTIERDQPLNLTSFHQLAEQAWARRTEPVRLLGLGVRFDDADCDRQLSLFDPQVPSERTENLVHQLAVERIQPIA